MKWDRWLDRFQKHEMKWDCWLDRSQGHEMKWDSWLDRSQGLPHTSPHVERKKAMCRQCDCDLTAMWRWWA
eukprot:11797723-Prorocentrum_lima.AAC.1